MGGENWVLNLGLLENGAAGLETPALSQDPGRGLWVKNNVMKILRRIMMMMAITRSSFVNLRPQT